MADAAHGAAAEDAGPAREQPPPPLADAPVPCASCGYDLRGSAQGGRCPECGTRIPRARLVQLGRDARVEIRSDLARAWNQLGFLALAPVLLLSPLPCLLPIGVPIAIALGFAPAFRLMALRPFALVPTELQSVIAPGLARLRRAQWIELVFVAAVAGYAVVATFGLAPRGARTIYFATLLAWWCVAAAGIGAQVRLGQSLAEVLAQDSMRRHRPDAQRNGDSPGRSERFDGTPDAADTTRLLRHCLAAYILATAGGAVMVVAMLLERGGAGGPAGGGFLGALPAGTTLSTFAIALLVSGSILFATVALRAFVHAELVARSIHGSVLGTVTPTTVLLRGSNAPRPIQGRRADATRPPPGPSGDDDTPIPLA